MRLEKDKCIVVTGGNGFLGKHVMAKLKGAGYENVKTFSSTLFDLTDMNDTLNMIEQFKPAGVIHLAARVGGIGANQMNPGKFCYENLAMGTNIIEASRKSGVKKLVIAGTICAYPKFAPVPFKECDLWKGYPEETNAPYGIAKKMLLVLSQAYRDQYDFNSVFLLPVNLYGPNDNFDLKTSHVIPAMIRKFWEAVKSETDVTLWGDGSPTREFLYVEDCAEAFVAAMERYDSSDPINIGTGIEISMKDLAGILSAQLGFQGELHWDTSRPNGQPKRCLDVSLARSKLNWTAKTTFDEGLAKTIQWYKEQDFVKSQDGASK